MARATGPEERIVGIRIDRADKPESDAGAAPKQRRLASFGLVLEGLTGVVIGPVEDRRPVIGNRLHPHHPHPRHATFLLPADAGHSTNLYG